jgi:DNA/RNA-binding domain of Phe-tRNA-synthetase-like protein
MLVRKANAVEEETEWATRLYHQCNQSIHVTDGVTVTSLSASLLQKIRAATDHLCQITLNQKLSHELKKWSKFSNRIKAKSHKMRPACILTAGKITQTDNRQLLI